MLAKISVCLILLMPTFIDAKVLPKHWKQVGEATLSILWFDVYTARLLTPTGSYAGFKGPLVLQLKYLRNISQQDLLKETAKQFKKFTSVQQANQWIKELHSIWPSLKKGDQLAFWIDQNGSGHFFLTAVNTQLSRWIGSVDDQLFGQTFIQIWLSKSSSYPKLAKQLRGAQ
jgi:hypothetical protein